MDLKEKVLKTLEDYGKSMMIGGLIDGFFEEYNELEIREAIWELIDEGKISLKNDRRLVAEKSITGLGEKILKTLREKGPTKIRNLKKLLFKEDHEYCLNQAIRQLLDSGKMYIDLDWKVYAA